MRAIKKILLSLLLLSLVLFSGMALTAYYFSDEIKEVVVKNLNQQLNTKVEVSTVDFSFWNSFPLASVVFSDVLIKSNHTENDSLLSVEELSVQFNLIDLYHQDYKLIGLEISKGKCALKVDRSGKENYIFWESNSETSSDFSIDLEKVKIHQVDFQYRDFSKHSNFHFFIEEASLSGNFSASVFNLIIKTKLQNSIVTFGENKIFGGQSLFVYAEGLVNQQSQQIKFKDANLGVNGMNLGINGSYSYGEESRIDLNIKSENADLAKATLLLPERFQQELHSFEISGEAAISGYVSGSITATKSPAYDFYFSIEKGAFKDLERNLHFQNTFLKGSINNGIENSPKTSTIKLDQFETKINHGQIKGQLMLSNFTNPSYSFDGNLEFALKDAASLFKWEGINKPTGNVKSALRMNGELASFGKFKLNDWKKSAIRGRVEIDQLGFQQDNKMLFKKINGVLTFNNNRIETNNLIGEINGNEISFSGQLNNLIGYLVDDKETLLAEGNVYSKNLTINDLITEQSNKSKEEQPFSMDFSSHLILYLECKFQTLQMNDFSMTDFRGDFILKNKQLSLRNTSFKAEEGELEGDFFLRENERQQLAFSCFSELKNVNIKKLFKTFDNFGQQTLLSENISGLVDANVRYYSEWSSTFDFSSKSLKVESDISIKNGVLSNFQPLESLSKYIELEELKNVRFKKLNNTILIEDETVYIPRFNVSSSALNLSLEGSHRFNQQINYQFTLLLNELLGKKVKKPKTSEFGYVEDDGLGRTKLFLKMTGTSSEPIIKYDSEKLKENVNERLAKEKQTFKSILKEEIGLFKKDSTVKPPTQINRKKSPFQVEYDSSFYENPGSKKTESNDRAIKSNQDKEEKKSKVGKFLDKIASPNEDDYVPPLED